MRVKWEMIIIIIMMVLMMRLRWINGLRFVIDKDECFFHIVKYDGSIVHFSYVVIKVDTPWNYETDQLVDLAVKGPDDSLVHGTRDKSSEKFEFVAQKKGAYKFCFANKSPYHETIDFDIHVGDLRSYDHHAKDEHLGPVYDQIAKLEEALYDIQFEQHWLEADTDRQASINEGMSRRAIHKAFLESLALIGASIFQVYLLRRLFERKLGKVRV